MAKRTKRNGKAAKPEPMVFEHVPAPEPEKPYERIAKRLLAATHELNEALKEAHQCAEMRVFIGATARDADHPMAFEPQIYRLTHSTLTFKIKMEAPEDSDPKMMWRAVKHPGFKDAAGQAFATFRKKAADDAARAS